MNEFENGYGTLAMSKELDKLQMLYASANLIWQTTNSAEDMFTPAQYEKLEYAKKLIEEVEQWLISELRKEENKNENK